MLLEGLFLPLTTPFFPDGRLNLRKLRQNVMHYSLTPAAGMVVLGANGETHLLSDTETREVLFTAIEAAAETKVMVAGVSRESVRGTIALIDEAAAMGYDVALVGRPAYRSLSAAELRSYFQSVADGSALPLLLSGELSNDLTSELAMHPKAIGYVHDFINVSDLRDLLKRTDSVKRPVVVTQIFTAVTRRMLAGQVGDGLLSVASLSGGSNVVVGASKAALKTRTKVVGLQLLSGGTERMLAGLQAGAVGAMVPFAAAAPQGCYEVYAAWKDGDLPLAEEKQARLVDAVRLMEGSLGVAGIKYGCDLNGYFGGTPRLPLLPMTGAERHDVEEIMAGLKS